LAASLDVSEKHSSNVKIKRWGSRGNGFGNEPSILLLQYLWQLSIEHVFSS
jgi:hypothetical protein